MPLKLEIRGEIHGIPKSIGFYNSKNEYTPDIVVKYSDKKDFYAIEKQISEKDVHLSIFKWILFAAEARKTAGEFFMVIPKSKVVSYEKLIQQKQIDVKLIVL